MAVPRSRSLLLFMFLLTGISMLSFLNCFSLEHSNGDLIWALCLRSFKEDPRSPTADLKTLAQISIDFSTSTAKSSRQIVKSLKQKVTEDRLVGIYDTCLENYGYSIDNLGDCSECLNSGDYQGLNIRASAAIEGPVTCDNSFKEAECSEPQKLKDARDVVQDSCNVILVIANRLKGGELLILYGGKGTHES